MWGDQPSKANYFRKEKRSLLRLIFDSSKLAYGSKGAGYVIPPDSTLIFVVEVVDVKARSLADVLEKTLRAKGVEAMIAEFQRLKSAADPDLFVGESELNGFGYSLLTSQMTQISGIGICGGLNE